MRIKDLVTSIGQWDWNLLQNLLPHNILLYLATVSPPQDDRGPDGLFLGLSSNDKFFIKFVYHMFADILLFL